MDHKMCNTLTKVAMEVESAVVSDGNAKIHETVEKVITKELENVPPTANVPPAGPTLLLVQAHK